MTIFEDPRRRCLVVSEWPSGDGMRWRAGLAPRRRFSQQGPAARLSTKSIEKYSEGYGRWLGFLEHRRMLDVDLVPAMRVTPERIAAYIDELVDLGNADSTIVGRICELLGALRILDPTGNHGWIVRPGGQPIRRRFAMRRRPLVVHHPLKLYRWGLRLMKEAVALSGPQRRRVMLRDGLLIALLAARGLRLGSVHALRLGASVRRVDGRWWIDLDGDDVKNDRSIAFRTPYTLSAWMDRYVEIERTELLQGKVHDELWIGWDGEPMGVRGIDKRLRWCSAKEFGEKNAFGSHRFRYGIATHGPAVDPGISAAILSITPRMNSKHYDRGKRLMAAGRFHKGLSDARSDTDGIAERHFGGRLAPPLGPLDAAEEKPA